MAEWLNAPDCKSGAPCGLRRFESSPVHCNGSWAHVAQSVERVLGKDEVTSSILVVGSIGFGFERSAPGCQFGVGRADGV